MNKKFDRRLTNVQVNILQKYLKDNDLRFGQLCALFGNSDFYTSNDDFFTALTPTDVTIDTLKVEARRLHKYFSMTVEQVQSQLGKVYGITLPAFIITELLDIREVK